MTPAKREHAIAYLEQTRAALLASTATLTESQWYFRPRVEAWSAADCVEHIAASEAHMLGLIRAAADGPAPGEEVLAALARKEDLILRLVPTPGRKVMAPEPSRPVNRFPNPAELLAHFIEMREGTLAFLRTASAPLRRMACPHPYLGPLDGYQWMIFFAAHTERHLKQLNALKADPEFPVSPPA